MKRLKILFYQTPEEKSTIEVVFEDETFWLSQKKMAELFSVGPQTINYHLKEIFKSKELTEDATIRKFRIVQKEGKRQVERDIDFFHLDAIIAVGYRVNSVQATQFRKWATSTLRAFLIKGFVLDDERLKQGKQFGKDYFDELLERIREIRASERRFYQKITDLYAQCSVDYDPNAAITRKFYKTVQNKLHWAITGKTAAELIASRVGAHQPHMGLTTWKNAPEGKILKRDVTVAKNYLLATEMKELNRLVTMYLDYAEMQAERHIEMTMEAWANKLDGFLQFNDYSILKSAGEISHDMAKQLAEKQYQIFRELQDKLFESDFDQFIKETPEIDEGTNEKDDMEDLHKRLKGKKGRKDDSDEENDKDDKDE